MCGIAGISRRAPTATLAAETQRMLDALAHRGPDDAGTVTFTPDEDAAPLALGARRLAIVDLSPKGHQPLQSLDGRYAIVFNGEIYNDVDVRRELEALGHRFTSRSDTEVLLGAFVQWGAACWRRCVGMFACAILDRRARTLTLARDPFGMKPLYYLTRGGMLAFASEIPPLLPLLGTPIRPNEQRLYDYLELGITDHGTETMFAAVQALPAAHYAEIDLQRPDAVVPVQYWTLDPERTIEVSFPDAVKHLRDLFLDSIARHCRSDVPVGALLSGGIDSSAIVMAMRYVTGSRLDLHTFSYIGGQGAISEEPWIDIVNAAAGAIPHKVHLSPEEWSVDAARLVETQNEPFGSIAIYAQNRVFRRVAETGIKVVLDGQGADELLAGYRGAWVIRLASLIERGRWVEALNFLRRLAGARQPNDPTPRRLALLALARAVPRPITALARRVLHRNEHPWIDATWCRRHGIAPMRSDSGPASGNGRLRRELWRAVTALSLPALLRYEDRNAMAYSVESRLPFLTPALAEFVLALPPEYLVGPDGTSKRVFREAMRGIVPDQILDRRDKIGFAVPVRTWLPAIPDVLELLDDVMALPPINRAAIAASVAGLRDGKTPSERESFLLWRLVGLAAWARRFGVAID
jgi:asparagine synthase (glutamine-hydrolysing)